MTVVLALADAAEVTAGTTAAAVAAATATADTRMERIRMIVNLSCPGRFGWALP